MLLPQNTVELTQPFIKVTPISYESETKDAPSAKEENQALGRDPTTRKDGDSAKGSQDSRLEPSPCPEKE